MTEFEIAISILSILLIIILLPSLKIVKINERLLIERLGKYNKTIETPGIYFIIPLVDRVITKIPVDAFFVSKKRKTNHVVNIHTYKIEVFDIMLYTYQALDPINDIHQFISKALDEGRILSDIEFLLEGYTQQFGINVLSITIDNIK